MPLDVLNQELGLLRVERNALARSAGSRGTPRPVNVGLSFLRRLKLDYEVYVRDIEPPRSNVGRDQHLELVLLEPLHRDLTLVLRNVAMHDFDVLLNLVREDERIGVGLGLGEDDGFAFATVANKDISKGRQSVLERTRNSQVLDRASSFVLEVLTEIDYPQISLHVLRRNISHPPRNCRGEQADLEVSRALAPDRLQDLVYIFLKAELEHLISFIEHHGLDVGEVDVSPLNVVEDTTRSSDEEVDTTAQLACLVLHGDATVDSQSVEFVLGVLQP